VILINRSVRRHEVVDRTHWSTRHVQAVNRTVRTLGIRLCGRCRVFKTLSQFGNDASCSQCHGQRTRQWEHGSPERAAVGKAIRSNRRRTLERQLSVAGAPVTWQLLALKWEYWGGKCHLCHLYILPGHLHWDHVIPLSKPGGQGLNIVANLRPAHDVCNLRKGSKAPERKATRS
jgi:5-methylcytosine-specific restriction endonuclease McrA